MFKRITKIFKLSNWKRWLVFGLTAIFAIVGISLGTITYVKPNSNISIHYAGGAELLIDVQNKDGEVAKQVLTKNVSKQIFERLTGGTGLNGTIVEIEGKSQIRVSRNGINSDEQLTNFITETTKKPILTLTDVNGNPIFIKGRFQQGLIYDESLVKKNNTIYAPPFKEGSVQSKIVSATNSNSLVQISLQDQIAQEEWTKATAFIASQANARNNVLIAWLDLQGLINLAKTKFPVEWIKAGRNPYNFVFTNETRQPTTITLDELDNDNKPITKQVPQVLKKFEFDASNYMISAANVQEALTGSSFTITGNFTSDQATNLQNKINFGIAKYNLFLKSSNFVSANLGIDSFRLAVIAGLIVFILIAIFALISYGVLGIISTLSLALYLFLTLLTFTALNGEYSPSSIAALVIGIGISVDANIINFERLKRQIYKKDSLQKAFVRANNISLGTVLDANITTLLVAIALFYFGTKSIKGFSVTLILSTIFTLIVMVGFTRVISTLIFKTKYFDNRLHLLGIRKKYIGQKSEIRNKKLLFKFNYMKNAKWFAIGSSAFIILGALVYFILIAINGWDFSSGFNSSIEFSGGTKAVISSNSVIDVIDNTQAQAIKNALIANDISESDIFINPINDQGTLFNITIISTNLTPNNVQNLIIAPIKLLNTNFDVFSTSITSQEATNLLSNAYAAISVAIVIVIAYALLRLRWTFAIAAIIAILHDIFFITAAFVLFKIEFSTIFVAALLSIIGYSINDTIVTFDRYKEIIKRYDPDKINADVIIKISNKAIKDTIKRSILTTITTLSAVLVLMSFVNATELSFNLALLIGLVSGTYSSIFIATYILKHLEVWRWKMQQKRINNKYWEVEKVKEQEFLAINDYVK